MRASLLVLALVCVSKAVAAGPDHQLDGRWHVYGAAWQMAGTHTYTFQNGTLTKKAEVNGGKDGTEPPGVYTETWTYRIDRTVSPPIIVTKLVPKAGQRGREESVTMEFDKEGRLHLGRLPNGLAETSLVRIK